MALDDEFQLDPPESSPNEVRASPPAVPGGRLVSLDAYRGFIMILLASVGFGLGEVAKKFPGHWLWGIFAHHIRHVDWQGCVFWDLIQPSFMFMVGVAMPFSFASRRAKGDSGPAILGHVVNRSIVLVLLGIFLMSNGAERTNFTFVNVLTQIGLAYGFAAIVVGRGSALQLIAIAAVLGGYWYAFYQHPLPGPGFDYAAVGVPADWAHNFSGLFAHWNKNTNWAAAIDLEFLNIFPPKGWFRFNEGGYQTLNFVPSIATLIFGIMAGDLLRGPRAAKEKLARLLAGGVACVAIGFVLGQTACPIVKRIWTPSWTVYAAGWTLLMLAGFYWIIDVAGWKRWAFPLAVVGMNPIAVYCLFMVSRGWIRRTIWTHAWPYAGKEMFEGTYGPIYASLAVTFAIWLICFWMYRKKIFIRI
ncbi:MAG: DUF5009 domain-containing protein [Planctomycetes bacterium]|nr:DUF5009 domain-containing protein [Planctomycetota bacterium]